VAVLLKTAVDKELCPSTCQTMVDPIGDRRCAKPPELSDLHARDLPTVNHPLQGSGMNTENGCGFVTIEQEFDFLTRILEQSW
jgi:hypothetical protein